LLGLALTAGLFLSTSGVAQAEHNSDVGTDRDIPSLVVELAEANQRLHDLGAAIQTRQEGVNKAISDVQAARDTAAAAQREVDAASQAVTGANATIAAAQQRFDSFAATTYINGPPGSYLTATSPEDMIATAGAGQTLSVGFQQALTDLRRARTELTNKESAARAAQQQTDQAAAEALRSQDAAVAALTEAQANFGGQQAEVELLVTERDTAQARLDAARAVGHSTTRPPPRPTAPAPADQWDRAPSTAAPLTNTSEWDTTLPMVPSADIAGDPAAIVNAVLQISSTSQK
jgi:septal ring factor EnvC (AmiA/AmiB activator)